MKRAVFFDLDDTLLWDNRSVSEALEATCRFASGLCPVDAKQLQQLVSVKAPELYATYKTYPFTQMIGTGAFEAMWADYKEGIGFEELRETAPEYRKEVWYQCLRELGVDDRTFSDQLTDRFIIERKKRSYVYEDTYETLNQLKEKGYRLLMLTNGSPDLQKTKLANEPNLAGYFDQIVISGNVGKGKPDPVIFEHALSLLELSANDVVMVGDRLTTDILGANRAGVDSIWLNRDHKKNESDIIPTYEIENLLQLFKILEA